MKKHLLLAAGLTLALGATAQTGVSYQWGKLIDGPTTAGDNATDVAINNEGDLYWFGTMGSTNGNNEITYGGELLYMGNDEYSGTSNNGNYTLLKTDNEGNKLWVVYSTTGDYASNAGGVAPTADGGCVIASKVRHTDGYTDQNLSLTDANGTATTIDWTCSKRYYKLMVNKISAAGEIEWTRLIDFSTTSVSGEDFWSDCFKLGNVAVDDNDNIYIPLNVCNNMSVPVADGEPYVYEVTNNKTWNGNSQSATGDFVLVKLDSEGYYSNHIALEGQAATAYCMFVNFYHGSVYAAGYATGNGNTLSVQDHTIAPGEVMSPIFLRANTDLELDWIKCLKAEKVNNQNAYQNVNLKVVGDNVWITAQYKLKLTDPDNETKTVAAKNTRDGLLLKLDAAEGSWVAATSSADYDFEQPTEGGNANNLGYLAAYQPTSESDKVYVYGFGLQSCIFLREYDANTLVPNLESGQFILFKPTVNKGMVTAVNSVYDRTQGSLYTTSRGNAPFVTADGTQTPAPVKWGVLCSRFDLPADMQTGISNVAVESDDQAPVEYYNLQGVRVANPSSGLYIRRQGSTATKIIL